MAMIIVPILLVLGGSADSQLLGPLLSLQDNSVFDNVKTAVVSSGQHKFHSKQEIGSTSFELLPGNSHVPEARSGVYSECHEPFQVIGSGCYYFSSIELAYSEASDYCQSLSNGHLSPITLALLDYDNDEDIALMGEVAAREIPYWLGGSTSDGLVWKWVDDRTIDENAPFWHPLEPDESENECLIAQSMSVGNIKRAYLYDNLCTDSYKFICETHPGCPANFVSIGNFCYFKSKQQSIPNLSWDDAKSFCMSLTMPDGYFTDLAVLGLPGEDSYKVMMELVNDPKMNSWLGAYEESNCQFRWIDNRTIPESTFYWYTSQPDECGRNDADGVAITTYENSRAYLYDAPKTQVKPFTCQMFHTML